LDIGIGRGFIRAIYEYIRKLPLFFRIYLADIRIPTFIRTFYHFIRKLPQFIRIFLANIRILPHQSEKAGRKGPASTLIIMFVQP
jgi:hypothetical protein